MKILISNRRTRQRQRFPPSKTPQPTLTVTDSVNDKSEIPLAGLSSRGSQVQRDSVQLNAGLSEPSKSLHTVRVVLMMYQTV